MFCCALMAAQIVRPVPDPGTCRHVDLDINAVAPDLGKADGSFIFSFENITAAPCSFTDVPDAGGEPLSRFPPLARKITLMPGDTAEEVVFYRIAPRCPTLTWLSQPVTLLLGLTHICSPMRLVSFGLAASGHAGPANDSVSSSAPTALRLSPELDTVHRGTTIRVKLERDDVGIPKLNSWGRPSLWLRIRRKDGETRVEHLFETLNYGGCLNSMG